MKGQPTEWEKIFTNDTTDKISKIISKIYKKPQTTQRQQQNNPITKWAEDLNKPSFMGLDLCCCT